LSACLALPPYLPGRGIPIELLDLRSDEEVVLLFDELLAHVYRLVLSGIGKLSHQSRLLTRLLDLL
jgi:hypothetical protein